MTITFDTQDRELVKKKLIALGLTPSEKTTEKVLHNIDAAFIQQLDSEIDYMITEFA